MNRDDAFQVLALASLLRHIPEMDPETLHSIAEEVVEADQTITKVTQELIAQNAKRRRTQ